MCESLCLFPHLHSYHYTELAAWLRAILVMERNVFSPQESSSVNCSRLPLITTVPTWFKEVSFFPPWIDTIHTLGKINTLHLMLLTWHLTAIFPGYFCLHLGCSSISSVKQWHLEIQFCKERALPRGDGFANRCS